MQEAAAVPFITAAHAAQVAQAVAAQAALLLLEQADRLVAQEPQIQAAAVAAQDRIHPARAYPDFLAAQAAPAS